MLKAVRVTNFKAVADSTLLPLQPLTAFIGRNGAGKSSILEALDWLGRGLVEGPDAATEQYHQLTDLIHGGDRHGSFSISLSYDPEDTSVGEEVTYSVTVGFDETAASPAIWSENLGVKSRSDDQVLIFTGDDSTSDQGTSFTRARYLRRVNIAANQRGRVKETVEDVPVTDPQRFALTLVDPTQHRGGALLRDFLERAVFLRLNPRMIASFAPAKTRRSRRLLDDEGQRLAELLGELDEETLEILVEKLASIISNASNVEAHLPQSPADRRYITLIERKVGGDELRVPGWVMSEGTRRMTAILALLLHPDPPELLCIEEVENGLDPWTLQFLLSELAGATHRGTQVILTTHSPYLIDMIGQDNIILCDRQDYGIEYNYGDRLPDTSTLQLKMGLGKLYTNRYLYGDKAQE